MNHIGLFEGIGGFSLAAHTFGIETIAWCEWNPFCQIILKDLLPNANQHNDIKSTDFTVYRGQCYLLTGGFPCQPFSVAGQQKGTGDDRYLWPEMFRAVREIQPRWVIAENVPGLVSWSDGLVFEQVLSDLESEGYEVTAFILPAASINAPHKRDRVWIVAYSNINGRASQGQSGKTETFRSGNDGEQETGGKQTERFNGLLGLQRVTAYSDNKRSSTGFGEVSKKNGEISKRNEDSKFGDSSHGLAKNPNSTGLQTPWPKQQAAGTIGSGIQWATSDSPSKGLQRREDFGSTGSIRANNNQQLKRCFQPTWQNFPTQSPVCIGNDGIPTDALRQRIREDSMGALSEKEIDKIISESVSYHRKESIKAGGNAIVPQVAEQIIQSILDFEKNVAYYQQ
jgi:DNA (cytosine-5)-methyltransferase 1